MTEKVSRINLSMCQKILEELKQNYVVARLKDYELYKDRTDIKVCFLRHDVDMEIDYALELAELEHDMGIQSTYFLLHTKAYFSKPDFIEKCKKLEAIGHEVGLHYDVLSVCIENPNLTPKYVFEEGLNKLRNNGLTVTGCAGHGGSFLYYKLVGYWIFKEVWDHYMKTPNIVPEDRPWNQRKFRDIDLYTLSLKEYGLYEAYIMMWESVRPMFYLSDCMYPEYDNLLRQIEKTLKSNEKFCMCLMHPCRYRIDDVKVFK